MPRCFIALGGNIGAVERRFGRALDALEKSRNVKVRRVSSTHRSQAVGAKAGGEFANAAAELMTDLEPLELLDLLQDVENRFHRKRKIHWGPRTLDLDLIFYGGKVIDVPRLVVPHPACWYRRFVLDPLAEIAPGFVHPVKGVAVSHLRERLLQEPFRLALAGGDESTRLQLIAGLEHDVADAVIEHYRVEAGPELTLVAWLGQGSEPAPGFEALPLVSRLDMSRIAPADRRSFLHDVLRSALGR